MNQADILRMESEKSFELKVQGQTVTLSPEDVEILSEDIPGWQVASEGRLTVALDTTLNEELREEGIAREFINRVQNLRKDKGYEVTDRIELKVQNHAAIRPSLLNNKDYICAEILAASLDLVDRLEGDNADEVEVDDNIQTRVQIRRHTPGQVN
jgi:isoleucyl-tRNA synthetase